jgi:hypothetical protein
MIFKKNRETRPREGLRRRAAAMLGFALAGFGSGQKSGLKGGGNAI